MLMRINKKGIWTEREWLGLVLPLIVVEFIGFKSLYPYADYFTDSYSYIQAAANQDAISFRPIGYSLFLRLVHAFAASDTLVVTLQYFLVQGASLWLVLWLRRWCGLKEGIVAVLVAFVLLDPVIPYVCNYISSDALFIGLSLIWLTLLMGLLREPCWWRLGLQLVLLFAIFHLRYVALFYPAVAALTVLLTRRGWVFRVTGVAASVGVVVGGMLWVRAITKRETGADLFSAFSGWQIANNALNVYAHIPVDTVGLPSPECRELAGIVKNYFEGGLRVSDGDSGIRAVGAVGTTEVGVTSEVGAAETRAAPGATTAYMWLRSSPLHQYLRAYRRRGRLSYFDAWNRVGVVFSQYGYFVAKKHPVSFLYYYGWPSAKTFFWMDLDNIAAFNEGKPNFDVLAKKWFHYPDVRVKVYSASLQGKLLAPMPGIYFLLNIAFGISALLFLPFAALRERDPVFTGTFRVASAFLLANAFFGIFASPSVFRYEVLPMIVLFVFSVCAVSKKMDFYS